MAEAPVSVKAARSSETGAAKSRLRRGAGGGGGAPSAVRLALLAWMDAYLCAVALVVVEALVVAARARRELAGPFELVRIAIGLLAPALTVALPVAVLGAVVLVGLTSVRPRRGRALLALLAAALGLFASVGTSGGRLLAGGLRPAFVVLVTGGGGATAWLLAPVLRKALDNLLGRGRAGRGAVVAAAIGVGALLGTANVLVLPRLYPAFHDTLVLASFLGLVVLATTWSPWRGRLRPVAGRRASFSLPRRLGVALVLGLLAVALAPWSVRRFSTQDNLRLIYLERSPMLAHVVRLAAWLSPPPPLDAPVADAADSLGERYVDFTGRDFLLVTIDAVRADHVGAFGYGRPTTPHLDALAQDGVLFEQAYSPTPHTSYAVGSLLTGKHLRPLMQQGLGADSETCASVLRRYGYRTAAFYPPAVFYIDPERFVSFAQSGLGFEYRKVEFASPQLRTEQLKQYLDQQREAPGLFVWVHLFEPHEPYVAHPNHDFGDRAIDRYDGEIAAADAGLGRMVELMRRARPGTIVMVASDHGEEFSDHGGRYHGTTVYDEQVRVPLVINAPGRLTPRRVLDPVSLVDLLPTVLRGLGIPLSPKIHGRDLGPLLVGRPDRGRSVMAETDELTLFARGTNRLICARRIGACRLYDTSSDPSEQHDLGAERPEVVTELKRALGGFVTSLGRYEVLPDGAERAASRWPPALRRAIAGEGDAALDAATLLDDADVAVRRRAAEALFELGRTEVGVQLQRALRRDEDEVVRRWCALALTRLGQGAPLTLDLLASPELGWQRLAALVLAEAGDDRGERVLVRWWEEAFPEHGKSAEPTEVLTFERAKDVVAALAKLRSRRAVPGLIRSLRSIRLRKQIATALGEIGEDVARPALVEALRGERHIDARLAMVRALVTLGASGELRDPLVWLLGVPDPLPGGLGFAQQADILDMVGGPRKRMRARLREYANSGVAVGIAIPETDRAVAGFRVLVRARSADGAAGLVRFGLPTRNSAWAGGTRSSVPSQVPPLDPARSVSLTIEPSEEWVEVHSTLPEAAAAQLKAGTYAEFAVYATYGVAIEACAVVPLSEELPPPAPRAWQPPVEQR